MINKEIYRQLFENTTTPILLINEEKVVFVNNAVIKLLDYKEKKQLTDVYLNKILNQENFSILKSSFKKLEENEFFTNRIKLKKSTEEYLIIDATISRIENSSDLYQINLQDITEIINWEKKTEYKIQLEHLLGEISRSFVNISIKEFRKNIEKAISSICKYADFSSIYLFYFDLESGKKEAVYYWSENITNEIKQTMQLISKDTIPWIYKKVFEETEEVNISNIKELPQEAEAERKILSFFEIQSFLVLPLEKNKKNIGLIGFNSKEENRKWKQEEKAALQVATQIFNNAYQHKKEKEKLAESEKKFRLLFETANDAIFLMSNDVFIDCNNKTLEMFNCKREEIIGQQPYKFSPEFQPDGRNSKEKALENINNALKGNQDPFEWVHITPGGKPFYVEVTLNNIEKEDGIILQAIVRDISERKAAEQKIIESEEKFKAVFHEAFQFIGIMDTKGILIEANESSLRLYNMEKENIIGKYFWDTPWWTHSVEEQEKLKKAYKRALNGEFVRFETSHLAITGKTVHVDFSLKPIKDQFGKINKLIPEGRDISDIKEMEAAVLESENKFKEIYRNSHDSILITSLEGIVIEVNEAFYKATGYSQKEIKGHNMLEFVNREYHKLFKGVDEKIKTQGVFTAEFELEKKNNETIMVELTSKVINFNKGYYLLSFARDISDRIEMERKMYSAILNAEEKERERLAGDLHDEIGPVLSSMKMYLNYIYDLEDKKKRGGVVNELKELTNEAIKNIREISNALSPHILSNHGLNEALKIIINQNQTFFKINYHHNILSTRFNSQVEVVYYRILKELINNTLRHANANKIEIIINYENETLVLNYKDNGIGFDYKQTKSNTSKGLGLYNILNRIKTINGMYIIETSPGNGFKLILKTSQVKEIASN